MPETAATAAMSSQPRGASTWRLERSVAARNSGHDDMSAKRAPVTATTAPVAAATFSQLSNPDGSSRSCAAGAFKRRCGGRAGVNDAAMVRQARRRREGCPCRQRGVDVFTHGHGAATVWKAKTGKVCKSCRKHGKTVVQSLVAPSARRETDASKRKVARRKRVEGGEEDAEGEKDEARRRRLAVPRCSLAQKGAREAQEGAREARPAVGPAGAVWGGAQTGCEHAMNGVARHEP
eukprot:52246-Chlamydomonas_euryale.AAC.1